MITVKVQNKIIYNGQSMLYTYLQNNKTLKILWRKNSWKKAETINGTFPLEKKNSVSH